jgi:hypothetical protein
MVTSSVASAATARSSARTQASASPTNRTLLVASAGCSDPCHVGMVESQRIALTRSASIAPVVTARTPGKARAASASTRTMRACGSVERMKLAHSILGRTMSSMKRAVPRRKRESSRRCTRCPKNRGAAPSSTGICRR